jgi:signal transduction histidine kinase/CheY-like chemotaxis protein
MAGETVLAVDDREDSLKFLQEYVLEPNGYKMIKARNGLEALEIIAKRKIDLVISDLVMPKMGGLELLESLQEKGLDLPAILMTFHGSEGTAVRAFRLGARDYIMKPFAIDEMINAIDRALTESRLRRERDQLTQTVLQVNRQLENRVQELRFLYGIGRSVTSLQDLEPILSRIVEAAAYLTKAEEGSLMLVDEDSGELYLRAARGMGEKSAKNLRLKIQDSIAGQVVRTGRPVMIGGIKDDSFKVKTGYFVKALLNVPLKVKDEVIGVLAVHNREDHRAFSERHLNLLLALADYASIAIDNARLYSRLSSDVDRAENASRELEKMVEARTAELKQAHTQLVQSEKLAALGFMSTGVAKEISAPIDTILKDLQELGSQLESTPAHTQLVASLEREAIHCRQTVQNLLNFSNAKEHQPQEADLNQVIEAAWARYTEENNINEGIEFIRGFDPNLPPAMVDSQHLEQAVYNLVRNAYKAMPEGGTLRITSRAVGPEVQIIVSDSGHGMAQEDMRHIFDPFYETNEQAYGLDLSITQAVVARHQGAIEVESEPGQGTTFTIRLPLNPA